VHPGPNNENALIVRVLFLYCFVNPQGAIKILCIEPAHNIEHRMPDILKVLQQVLALPVLIVGSVIDEFIPGRYLIVKQLLVDIGNGAELKEKIVSIRRTVSKGFRFSFCGSGTYPCVP